MLSLHTATDLTKQIFKWIGIIIAGILLLVLIFRAGRAVKHTFFPDPPPAPTVDFGKLPPIIFPENTVTKSFTYSQTLGNLTGKFPVFPNRLKVFKIIDYNTGLLSLKNAREKIAGVGFTSDYNFVLPEMSLGNSIYEWIDNSSLERKMIMNTTTNDFSMTSSYLTAPDILNATSAPIDDDAKQKAEDFLNSMQLFPTDIDKTKTKTQYLKINDTTLSSAISVTDGKVTRVDFFQQDIDESPIFDAKLPIYYPEPNYSLINFIIATQNLSPQVVEANFFHQAIDTDTPGTYPIKTAQQAFADLQKGNAYIASYTGNTNTITIQDIKLGYYLGKEKTKYLLPIVVFLGNDNFVAYVSAIPDTWFIKQ